MPKYLLQVNYSLDGVKGVWSQGGSARKAAGEAAAASVGGALESMYFAFGDTDVFAVADLPNNAAAAALAGGRSAPNARPPANVARLVARSSVPAMVLPPTARAILSMNASAAAPSIPDSAPKRESPAASRARRQEPATR